ncbi:glutamate racemase [Kozakia baliensis]|uniref:Glutamate racemase n=1 Tax=Kozakia baliensis TaxID=153496 RepID=A0A1D8US59_9PROT|nr:aspartate/glutamate racemase family protein [Kozakia baliensis]AOX16495.1 glutamate racemase [Kozakia baliensis]GBR29242.1 glutamate racemase [Kozakia baliensis NRIC 0488]GEL63409.1 glutamate racemase [Kozakia baliensis]
MPNRPGRVLAFDSGIGGLGIVRALREVLPPETRIDYLADNALFPYGEQADDVLIERLLSLLGAQIEARRPDLVVIACNTASTLALPALRARFPLPFVGCVPPVRWAARVSTTHVIGLLSTAATARRPYLRTLQQDYAADCTMLVHGARGLADLAERAFLDEPLEDALVLRELTQLFDQPEGDRIDAVGLGCTHYTFLMEAFTRLSPPGVAWLDPAMAVARQAGRLLVERPLNGPVEEDEHLLLTAPPPNALALTKAVRRIGYVGLEILSAEPAQCARLTV